MEKYLTYNHASVAPINIQMEKVYLLEELQKNLTLEEIKCFFKPDNFKWDEPKIAKSIEIDKI